MCLIFAAPEVHVPTRQCTSALAMHAAPWKNIHTCGTPQPPALRRLSRPLPCTPIAFSRSSRRDPSTAKRFEFHRTPTYVRASSCTLADKTTSLKPIGGDAKSLNAACIPRRNSERWHTLALPTSRILRLWVDDSARPEYDADIASHRMLADADGDFSDRVSSQC